MLKRIVLFVALAIATLAFAIAQQTSAGSYGHGTAINGARIATFDYNVNKSVVHKHESFSGWLHFTEHGTHAASIEMGAPTSLSVSGHACDFAGPGSLTSLDAHGHPFTVHGHVSVHVVDNRNPHHAGGDPDSFAISFHGKTIDYSFDGSVHDGDLVVFSK
jgi:hypothetical protein